MGSRVAHLLVVENLRLYRYLQREGFCRDSFTLYSNQACFDVLLRQLAIHGLQCAFPELEGGGYCVFLRVPLTVAEYAIGNSRLPHFLPSNPH